MAVLVGKLNVPNYTFLSSEISSNKVPGISIVGAVCLATDTGNWYILKEDLTLQAYALPVDITINGGVTIGTVTQGTGGSSAWIVDTELPTASALDGTIGKGLSAPTVGAAILVSDGTNLKQVSSTYPVYVTGNVGRSATSVTPTAQGSTDSWTLVAGSTLDTLNNLTASYTVQNTEVTNSVDYKIKAGNASNFSDAVEVQAAATILAGAYGSYAISIAPWRYYGVFIQSTVLVTPASVLVRGVTKG